MGDNPVIEFLERRRSVSALALVDPAPDAETLKRLLAIAGRVPDHGKMGPWRFVVIGGETKERFVRALERIAAAKPDSAKLVAALKKLRLPPLCVCVISNTRDSHIPEWEQILSAGAVCMNLLTATLASGFGANWLTGWWAYDQQAAGLLGLSPDEKVAGMMMIGTPLHPPEERPRPDVAELTTRLEL